jgi:cystathionine beta-lyase
MVGESSKSKGPAPLDLDGHDLPPSPAPSTPRNGRKYALMTELVYSESTDQYNASSVPIYQVRVNSRFVKALRAN